MSTFLSLWHELAGVTTGTTQNGYFLRLMGSYSGCRMYAALNMPERLKSIVIGVSESSLTGLDLPTNSAAFRCIVSKIDGLGDGQSGLVLTLNDVNYEDLFILLLEDVIEAAKVENSSNKAVAAIFRTIERWRRFIERMGLGTLSDEEVQGLIGELTVLARLVIEHGERTAVVAWVGPNGAIHDFTLGETELEVKTHQGSLGGGIWINDLAQLQPIATDSLYLVVPCIASAGSVGHTLPQFIAHLKELLKEDAAAGELFSMKLATVGYLDSLAKHYSRRYAIGEVSAYRVAEGFPAIVPSTVPPAVEKVRYRLRLASLESWRIDVRAIVCLGMSPWEDV